MVAKLEIIDRIRMIIAKELAIEGSVIVESARLEDDLGADSLNRFSIFSAVEEEFGVELDQEEILEIDTVGQLIDYTKKLVSKE